MPVLNYCKECGNHKPVFGDKDKCVDCTRKEDERSSLPIKQATDIDCLAFKR